MADSKIFDLQQYEPGLMKDVASCFNITIDLRVSVCVCVPADENRQHHLLTESGDRILTEAGDRILLEVA